MKPIVRNKFTNDLYEYNGGNRFTNLRTLKSGIVTDEAAQNNFLINMQATMIANEYPMVKELINKLNLKFSNQ